MSIRDHFRKKSKTRTKIGSLKSKVVETDQTESLEYLKNFKILKESYYPPIDYSDPNNFSRYSNPYDSYEMAIRKIYETYPYDGTLAQKLEWQNLNSFLDKSLFEGEYPRHVGHITFSASQSAWGTRLVSSSLLYGHSDIEEYIEFTGGPHSGAGPISSSREAGRFRNSKSANSVRWNESLQKFDEMKLSNLYNSGTLGNTVEFWLKRDSYDSSLTKRQVILDVWNGVPISDYTDSSYGRFRIEYVEHDSKPLIYVTYLSPSNNLSDASATSSGVLDCALGYTLDLPLEYYSEWQHVAISIKNDGKNLKIYFYLNGQEVEKKIAYNQACAVMPGPHYARLGGLATGHELDQLPISISFNKTASINGVANNDNTIIDVDVHYDNGQPVATIEEYLDESNLKVTLVDANLRDWIAVHRLRKDPTGTLADQVSEGTLKLIDDTAIYITHERVALDAPGVYRDIEIGNAVTNPGLWVTNFGNAIAGEAASTIHIRTRILNSIGDVLQTYYTPTDGSLYSDLQEDKVVAQPGSGKASISLDDFRFWKTRRTSRQISRWHIQQVGGGSNDREDNETLGVYYKFNEGIHGTEAYDKNIIDYAGRGTNAKWIGKPTSSGRSLESAIESKNPLRREFRDPVLYSSHPDVVALLEAKRLLARTARKGFSSQLWRMLPAYLIDLNNVTDENTHSDLRNMLNIVGSYLDELWLQIEAVKDIKQNKYETFSKTPAPFMKRMLEHSGLETPDIFIDSSIHELLHAQTDNLTFERDLTEVKNLIYQNIYSNLNYVYKTKGTMEGFNSLIRCFGIDEEILKVNLYASETEYKFEDNYKIASTKRNYIDFDDKQNTNALIYQTLNDTSDSTIESPAGASLGYLPALLSSQVLSTGQPSYPVTFEAEFFFPKRITTEKSSLFGCYAYDPSSNDSNKIQNSHFTGDFQVYVQGVNSSYSDGAKFILELRLHDDLFTLETDFIDEVFDDSRWTFAVSISGPNPEYQSSINSSAAAAPLYVRFFGARADSGHVEETFSKVLRFDPYSHTVKPAQGAIFAAAPIVILATDLQCYMGSRYMLSGKPTFDIAAGALTNPCYANPGFLRVWASALSQAEVNQHAVKPLNYGVDNPMFGIIPLEIPNTPEAGLVLPKAETLMLDWNFSNVTESDATGSFYVSDYSAGTAWAGASPASLLEKIKTYYTAKGVGFEPSTNEVVDSRYIPAGRLSLPETVASDDTIRILTSDDVNFTLDSKPKRMYIAIEKSMYQNISQEMLKVMHSITEFNTLIGAPVNKYRQEYNDLNKLREIFFRNIENTPDLEKYLSFYKWIDSSMSSMLQQLMPATADQPSGQSIRNIIESHAFERSKFQHKFPELVDHGEPPETVIRGHAELNYNWRIGHAPIGQSQNENALWWSDRAERDSAAQTPAAGTENLDQNREHIREAIIYQTTKDLPDKVKNRKNINLDQTSKDIPKLSTDTGVKYEASPYFSRRLNKHTKFSVAQQDIFAGGSNFGENKKTNAFKSLTRQLFTNNSEKSLLKIQADFSTIVDTPAADEANIGVKRKLHLQAFHEPSDGSLLDNDIASLLPFSIYERKGLGYNNSSGHIEHEDSSAVSTGYALELDVLRASNNLDVTNLHTDSYGDDAVVPMQGPFTSQHVGGNQYRHIPWGTAQRTDYDPADFTELGNFAQVGFKRPEIWKIGLSAAKLRLSPPDSLDGGAPFADGLRATKVAPTALWMRDEGAKRPVNIRNIKNTVARLLTNTNSGGKSAYQDEGPCVSRIILGNYTKQYEIMRAGSIAVNNRDFIKNTQNYSDLESLSLFNRQLREDPYRYDALDPVPRLTDPSPERYKTLENAPMSFRPAQDNFLMGYWFDRALANLSGYGLLAGHDIEDDSVFVSGTPATGTYVQFPYTWFDNELVLYENTSAPGAYIPASQFFITESPLVPIQAINGVSDSSLEEALDHYSVIMAGLPKSEASGDFIYNDPVVAGIRPRRQLYSLLFSGGNPWSLRLAGQSSTFSDNFYDGVNSDPIINIFNIEPIDREAYDISPVNSANSYNVQLEPAAHTHRTDRDRDATGVVITPSANGVYFSGRPSAQVNSTLFQLPFTPTAGNLWRAPNNATAWTFEGAHTRFSDPMGADAQHAGDPMYDVLSLGKSNQDPGDESFANIVDWPGLGSEYGQVALYNTTISPKSSPNTRVKVSFDIAGAQIAANTGVARNDYFLTKPPEAAMADDVWVQYADADDLNNWTTLEQIRAANLSSYSDWTPVACDYVEIANNHPGLKFRIVNRISGASFDDQWIMRNFKIKVEEVNTGANSLITEVDFAPAAPAGVQTLDTFRSAATPANWTLKAPQDVNGNTAQRFIGPRGNDIISPLRPTQTNVLALGNRNYNPADGVDAGTPVVSNPNGAGDMPIADWPGMDESSSSQQGGSAFFLQGQEAVYNQVIMPRDASRTRIKVSFEIAGVQVAANTGVARNDYGLTNPPEAQPVSGQHGDDVWIQYASTNNLNNWTTIKQVQASLLANYSDWTMVECDHFDIASDNPGVKFRIVNQVTGNGDDDQWIIRNFQIEQMGFTRLLNLNNASNPDLQNGRPADPSTNSITDRWTKHSVIRGVDTDGDADDGTIASPDPSNGEPWSLDVSFEVAAFGTDVNGSSDGIAKDNFGINSGPTSFEDFYLLYKRSDSATWAVWKKLLGSDAADGDYLDWSLQELSSIDNIPSNVTVQVQIMSYIDMEGFDRFASPHPTGATWIMRNLQFERGAVVAEDVSPRWYSAMRLNLPFVRKAGLNDTIDISFDIQYLEASAAGPVNDYQEDLYLVVAEKGANWDTQGTNPEITVRSYHEIDLSGITAYSSAADTMADRIAMVTEMRTDRASAPVDLVSVANIPIPVNKEILFYIVSERTHEAPEYVFVFSDIAIHHSGEVRLQGYTPKDIADYTQMRNHAPFEKQNINRMPSGDHIIIERFSSPGDIYTMGEGSLDRLSGQYSPYNALSFRNRKLSNILNIESSKVYNGPYDSTIAPTQQIHDARANNKVPLHKTHRNSHYNVASWVSSTPDAEVPLMDRALSEWGGLVEFNGVDIIDVP